LIGNDSYSGRPLVNAVNDVNALKPVLESAGFKVSVVTNATLRTLDESIDRFTSSVHSGDTALFFYSGHGMQIEDQNYLIPVDFAARTATDAKYGSYPIGRLIGNLESAGAALQIIVLDACRDNPFKGLRGGGGGLGAMNAAAGTYIAYAAAPGQTASDNPDARNGLFTGELVSVLRQPGLTIDQVFNQVRARVRQKSGNQQVPWSNSSVIGEDFYFIGSARPVPERPTNSREAICAEAWNILKDSDQKALLDKFLADHGACEEAALARLRMEKMASDCARAWDAVKNSTQTAALDRFAADRASCAEAPLARQRSQELATTRVSDRGKERERALQAVQVGDYPTAVKLLTPLAEKGDQTARARLGELYLYGRGVPNDPAHAAGLIRPAAAAGETRAMALLSIMFRVGSGVEKNPAESFKWARLSADKGDTFGFAQLGSAYAQGVGVPKDEAEGVKWYRKSAELGDPTGMNLLGIAYVRGMGGLDKDDAEALQWYRKAADLGLPAALSNVGSVYREGRGVPKDGAEAVKWYRKAVDLGEGQAAYNLGLMYEQGNGVEKSEAEARNWYQKGADLGYAPAKARLGKTPDPGSTSAEVVLSPDSNTPADRIVKLTPSAPSAGGEATLVAPGNGYHNYNIYYIDVTEFARGTLDVQIQILPRSATDGSFSLYKLGTKLVAYGRNPADLVGSYDVKKGNSTQLEYKFKTGQMVVFVFEGNWFSPKGAKGQIRFRATVKK
jgi:TPR repeat protein